MTSACNICSTYKQQHDLAARYACLPFGTASSMQPASDLEHSMVCEASVRLLILQCDWGLESKQPLLGLENSSVQLEGFFPIGLQSQRVAKIQCCLHPCRRLFRQAVYPPPQLPCQPKLVQPGVRLLAHEARDPGINIAICGCFCVCSSPVTS